MFIINWLFDKLGYMPKIDCVVGKADLELKKPWPFPVEVEVKNLTENPKPIPKTKPKVVKKPAAKRASTRKPKAK